MSKLGCGPIRASRTTAADQSCRLGTKRDCPHSVPVLGELRPVLSDLLLRFLIRLRAAKEDHVLRSLRRSRLDPNMRVVDLLEVGGNVLSRSLFQRRSLFADDDV